ncbi:MAG: molybdopterin-binding protein [Alphaproteobacteria bacterium]
MKFLTQPANTSAGWHLAQAVRLNDRRLPKGAVLSAEQATVLGDRPVQVYALEPGDLSEDAAATALRQSLFGAGLQLTEARTGRVNALAAQAGLAVVDAAAVASFNAASEALTLATLPPLQRVEPGDLVATLKIIPFAVPEATVQGARPNRPLLRLQPLRAQAVQLIQTQPETVKDSTLDKSRDALAARLESLGSRIVAEHRVAHHADAVATALDEQSGDLIIIFPGAATQDRRDVGPAGLSRAGGTVAHVGMPVDPGNLLFIGSLGETPVIGAPGCARSVAFNGFDWVLERACADLFPTPTDIQGMGVGGLLKEIKSRPLPRLKA